MSAGIKNSRKLDASGVGVTEADLPPLPDDLSQAIIDPRAWFARPDAPLEIEIGSGKGTFIVEEAARRPNVNFLGIEWAREFYMCAADRCRRHALTNVRILHTDATQFLRFRFPPGAAHAIHLYFSDPWPKKRHHKRRVVQDAFLTDAHRALAPEGELRIVTDHKEYWQWMENLFTGWCDPARKGPRFERRPFTPDDRAQGAQAGELVGTNFERKYAREGRPFYAAVLKKIN